MGSVAFTDIATRVLEEASLSEPPAEGKRIGACGYNFNVRNS
jgi:hypothetical protein